METRIILVLTVSSAVRTPHNFSLPQQNKELPHGTECTRLTSYTCTGNVENSTGAI